MTNENALKNAAVLIYLSLGLGIPNVILSAKYDPSLPLGPAEIFFGLVVMGLIAGLAYKIGQGKKWAIWTYTIMFLLGLFTIGTLANAYDKNLLFGLVGTAQFGLQLFALYLIHESKLKSLFGFSDNRDESAAPSIKTNVTVIKEPGEAIPKQRQGVNSNTIIDLGKFHELLKSGAITQEEFDQQKKKILGKVA